MEQGYEDTRFENTVDRHFHCPICLNVLRDPVQCRRNQHYFCTPCITKHLQENSQTCPTCMEELTVQTLGRPTRLLTSVLSTFKIACDYTERGCREMVELGALKRHVAGCDFGPVMCSNDECLQVVDRRDKEVHKTKMCDFRTVKCDYCGEEMQYAKIKNHRCPTTKEIDEIKLDMSEVKVKLNRLCSAQQEMAKAMATSMSDIKESVANIKQTMAAMQSSCPVCHHPANVTKDIAIVGGADKAVEIFSWAKYNWTPLGKMNKWRLLASSFVYEGHMVVTGGLNGCSSNDSMEKIDLNNENGRWINSPVKLPFKCHAHQTLLYQNRLILIGGMDNEGSNCNTIYEILLTHPYSSKLLTDMPLTRSYHGAERIGDKIYILGGHTSNGTSTGAVLMYDLVTNSCKEMEPLPSPVSTMATVGWKDSVIVLGGNDHLGEARNTVISYDVNTGKSTMLPEMRKRRGGCAAVVTGNKIVVMGGEGGGDEKGIYLNSVECYNFDTNTWEELPPMIESRIHATAVVKPV